jgi:hypothetical protein
MQRAPRGKLLNLLRCLFAARSHNAEVEGSSPSLTTIIKKLESQGDSMRARSSVNFAAHMPEYRLSPAAERSGRYLELQASRVGTWPGRAVHRFFDGGISDIGRIAEVRSSARPHSSRLPPTQCSAAYDLLSRHRLRHRDHPRASRADGLSATPINISYSAEIGSQ